MANEKITAPEGGWLGLMVRVGQESKSEQEYDTRLPEALTQAGVPQDHLIWDFVWQYGWKSAKRAAFCSPGIRMMVERSLLKEVL